MTRNILSKRFALIFSVSVILYFFQACSSVSSVKALPSDDSPVLRAFPSYFEGDFEVIVREQSNRTKAELGQICMKMKLDEEHKLIVHRFRYFDEEELSVKKKYFNIQGEFLVFKNDSLNALKQTLKEKKRTDNLDYYEKEKLKDLEKLEKEEKIFKTYQLQREGEKYIYDEQLFFEIDLKKNEYTSYEPGSTPKTDKCILKKYKEYHILNMFNTSSKHWEAILLKEQDDDILIQLIHFENLKKNQDFYKSLANIKNVKKYNIVIDPSKSQFDSLMKDENFLEEHTTLIRIDKPFSLANNMWLPIGIIILLFVVFIILKKTHIL